MQIYLVGGAVRDALMARELGLPAPAQADRDWVVVGATPEAMVAEGYEPVGRDFPVFLHPQTHEEYALARTERKTAPGYHGFAFHAAPDVTLEQDLARRDLTINAMAVAAEDAGHPETAPLIDPWGGLADLRAHTLRHVTEAFAEDPVRILRLARFRARWPGFGVAPETATLMRAMVERGEVDHLVAERVWQEVARGLQEARPGHLLETLRDCGALPRLLPTPARPQADRLPAALPGEADAHALFTAAPLSVRWAWLVAPLDEVAQQALGAHWRVPNALQDLAQMARRERADWPRPEALDAAEALHRLLRCDALRKPARCRELLRAIEGLALSDADGGAAVRRGTARLENALQALQALDTATVVQQAQAAGAQGEQIGERLHAARLQHLLHRDIWND
jgi:tRNA nucleotidyltransferase (CCA-adding enzyme)